MTHYRCNLRLAESCYPSLSVFEVALRNAISREFQTMTGREDWYSVFPTTTGLKNLNHYITLAAKQMGWINRDLPEWVEGLDNFGKTCAEIRKVMDWK